MDVLGRYNSLVEKHAELERQLEVQAGLPHPDDGVVSSLKKQKLMMKDEMRALESRLPERQASGPPR